ncbi:MAG: transglutaminase family protein [Gammaproteobacteria bacterium]|nr:transglutaminase family protein [Gammaproteobacteria bacterium]
MKRIRIQHSTSYRYSEPVTLMPHKLMIRPRAGHDIQLESSSLAITPGHTIKWHRDIYGNSVAVVTFLEPSTELSVVSDVVITHYESAPLDFLVDEKAVNFPFYFDPSERVDLIPFQTLCFPGDSDSVRDWLQQFWQPGQVIETYVLLDRINKHIVASFNYRMREEPGVQRPADTLAKRSGSCRDFATLFIEACRYFGLAARFVSGYLHCPETVHGHGSTHAWAEVYLPGAGWIGFDNTSGIVVGQEHIAVAVTRHPGDAPPISGSFRGPVSRPPTLRVEVIVSEAAIQAGVNTAL